MALGLTEGHGSGAPIRDAAWFDQLFAEHAVSLHRYFVRRTPRQEAEDLVAEVFAVAWRRRDSIPDDFVLPWLYKTASYVLSNHRRKPTLTLLADVGTQSDERSRSIDPADLIVEDDDVRNALARLSARDRKVLMLHAWEGLDGEGLAKALGVTRGGAAAALSRARARLREAWAT